MTETLVEKTCTPCRGGVSPLTSAEAGRLHAQAPEWKRRGVLGIITALKPDTKEITISTRTHLR